MAKKLGGRDLWIIEYKNIDPSRDAIVAYESRKEAIEAAADFVRAAAEGELEGIGWEPEDEAPKMLKEILRSFEEGSLEDAIVEWLEYQSEYDPNERIAIGPSGSVSDRAHDFPA